MSTPLTERADQSGSADVPQHDWVLALRENEPAARLAGSVRWTAQGSVRACLWGALASSNTREDWESCSEAPTSDADTLIEAYRREGDAMFARLRGSFVACLVDCSRRL